MRLMLIGLLTSSLMVHTLGALPLFKETEHFILFCTPTDQAVAEKIVNNAEMIYGQLAVDFKSECTSKINLEVYPDLESLHQALKWPDAPDWIACNYNIDIIRMVSPNNPGPAQTYDNVMRSNQSGVVATFIYNIYPHHSLIPRWLHQGVALYKMNRYSDKHLKKLKENISSLTTFEYLEAIDKEDDITFLQANGFLVSYAMVQFIEQKWGWDSILALLADYTKFEEILKISKQEFWSQWIKYLQNNEFE
jgi:RNA polymerase sigma-70 factor, ECF subfamily